MSGGADESRGSDREVREETARGWMAAFNSDEPLYKQFPVRLINGKTVPGIRVVCSPCGQHLTGDRLRGRVVQSLPHVVSVSANGMCVVCERLTHVDFRLRAHPGETMVEWLATNGQWQAKEVRPSTLLERAFGVVRRLRARLRSAR